jgi:DNA ligase 1
MPTRVPHDPVVLLDRLAAASAQISATSSRSAKVRHVAEVLRAAAPEEIPIVVAYLSGELRQRRTGLGYAALRDLPAPATTPALTVTEVDRTFERMSALTGKGSQAERRRLFQALMGRATREEQRLLTGLVSGELRQGALDGVMLEAVARAADVPSADVRQAVTLAGTLTPVAGAVLGHGAAGLDQFRLEVGTPLRPMLAQPAPDLTEALTRISPAGVEWKLDGIRVQVHRSGSDVRVFTRTLEEITDRVPEVGETVRDLPARSLVLDGEAIALGPDRQPRPFQVTASRTATRGDVEVARSATPLTLFAFDVLHVDGRDYVGEAGSVRWAALEQVAPETLRVPRIVTSDVETATAFLQSALAQGHEGVVVKSLAVPYEAGRRGYGWLKVKPRHTLDLVVLAVEWGHGRRTGTLSNLHLGARDPEGAYGPPGGFVMLGKTFKGLTDAMLAWQTERLLALAEGSTDGWVVRVRPELVVEIAFDGVQTSPRYPAKMALRFARVIRYREDKPASEADTVESVRAVAGPPT